MKKILFLIHSLAGGGAERVLVNLVNHMDKTQFDITVMVLFGGGVNEQLLAPHIHFKRAFPFPIPKNTKLMKLLEPRQLHRWLIKEHYDIEISYLEGSASRVISGCSDENTKLVCWIHRAMRSEKEVAYSFRNEDEAMKCYRKFDNIVFVSNGVRQKFLDQCPLNSRNEVLYNTNDNEHISKLATESVESGIFSDDTFCWCGVGKLVALKGFDRMLRIQKRLFDDGHKVRLLIIGAGVQENELRLYCKENGIIDTVTFLGYQTNPYKYISKCDLFVCASHTEGFSTAATEALIVGTPVCTVEVPGMKEMLGEHNEYGVVTGNDDEALYRGIYSLLCNPALLSHYRKMAVERGKTFSTQSTVKAVEVMLMNL